MLQLILGRAGAGKTTQVLSRLCERGQKRPQVLIVPEQQSHETERALCARGGSAVSLYAEVLSFSQLANRVFQEAGGLGEKELDAGGRLLLMYRAVKQVSSRLTVYSRPSKRPAFLQSLLATADELKSCCVQPGMLIEAGEAVGGPEGEKLRDLGLICAAYHELTLEIALDPRDRLTRAAEKLKTCLWAKGKDLWLDGFLDFTPQQMELLRQLLRQAENVTVALTCDKLQEDEDGMGIFSPARKTAAALRRLAKEENIRCKVEILDNASAEKDPALIYLERQLFAAELQETCPANGSVELFRANSPRSEVEWTAGRILGLVREEGFRFREIGVVTRSFGKYRDLVESVFAVYGIPVFSSVMSDILEKPVLALVTAALETVSNGYLYDDVFRYLKTGLTNLSQDTRDLLENYVLKWDIRGSRWTQDKSWNWHPRGYGNAMEEEDRELLTVLDKARRSVAEPLEQLRQNTNHTGKGQALSLYRFLEQIGLPERLEERVQELERRGQPALAGEYRQLWEILCGGLEQCAALLGDAPMELDEFSLLFRLVLSQYDVGTIPVSLDRVTAGETTRQTGHRVKALFLLGADDGSIPQAVTAPGLLSDDDRTLLAEHCGVELHQSQRDMLCREMTTVYQNCTSPDRKLFVSWPGQGISGEENRPCFLAERLQRLFSDLTVVQEDALNGSFRLEAPRPALEQAGRNPVARKILEEIPQYSRQVSRLVQAAQWQRGHLSRTVVDRLYGQEIPMSASRMDKYRSCHFSYFMRYGLKAEPRKSAGFTAPEYGTFVHYVLEQVLKDPECGIYEGEWSEEKQKKLHRMTEKAVERYVDEELGGLEGQTERFKYLFRRLLRSVKKVVDNAAEELTDARFKPIRFELGFGSGEELPPIRLTVDDVTISVTGFVDRVDGWVKDGKLYLRVVDYKTGRKTFDLTEVWNGLGLQMLLYLFALENEGEKLFGLPTESAGVLYLPARDAVIQGSRVMDDETWRKEMDKQLVRKGLLLDDPNVLSAMERAGENGYRFLPLKVSKSTGEISGDMLVSAQRLGRLGRHIQSELEEICKELARGDITADPFWRGPDKNACRYCDYAAACHFEEGRGGDCKRWLASVSAAEFWEKVERKEERN